MISAQALLMRSYLWLTQRVFANPGELDVQKDRRELEKLSRMFKPLQPTQFTPLVVEGIPAEWAVPAGLSPQRTILYLHGGSFNAGSILSHRALAANLAAACKARALLIDYRLAPEHPFPAANEDALKAYKWLLGQGVLPNQLLVMGDSAGGMMTLTLLINLRQAGVPLPAAAVCLSPATDLTLSGETWSRKQKKDVVLDRRNIQKSVDIYLVGADPCSPLTSPLFADLHGLPPLLIQVGSDECLLSDAEQFAEKAKAAGSPVSLEVWEGMQHVWQFAASLVPEGRQAIERIGAWVERTVVSG